MDGIDRESKTQFHVCAARASRAAIFRPVLFIGLILLLSGLSLLFSGRIHAITKTVTIRDVGPVGLGTQVSVPYTVSSNGPMTAVLSFSVSGASSLKITSDAGQINGGRLVLAEKDKVTKFGGSISFIATGSESVVIRIKGDVSSLNDFSISPVDVYRTLKVVNPGASVRYRTHVQTYGDQAWKKDGEISGTTGESKRLEAVYLSLASRNEYGKVLGGIRYRTHVQTYGWQDWVSDGSRAGTAGESKRLEAVRIELTGRIADVCDVYYRVHAQRFGWLSWAKNGETAGTAGFSYRLEAIEVVLVPKGQKPPAPDPPDAQSVSYVLPRLSYRTHVQTYGWQAARADGQTAGTSGESKRLEAIEIRLQNQEYGGGIRYQTHVQTYGWMPWVRDGRASGTSGEGKRLEAVRIALTGEMAERYDVYYHVHAQNFGWLGWAKNGDPAGTAGFSYRLEAIEIILVKKGGAPPGSTQNAFVSNI